VRILLTRVSLLFVVLTTSGCSAAAWQGLAQGLAAASPNAASSGVGLSGYSKLMLFGGPGNRTYLGCLNCNEYATDSVFNSFGSHGSSYASDSIFNAFRQFGSKFSSYSPCNAFASNPPVIVDANGNFWGYLTVNDYKATNNQQLRAWVAGVCAGR
jgi:hypothetical protein